ncbi:MAG: ABC transporter ATP-binding protein [Elusimicrobia bacterium]|nr:ABC transporter ATP-binding protein [Elusimicrobiota bacterium]
MGISAREVDKELGEPPALVLRGVSLEIADGEFVAVTGRSGSGKSTLLYLLSSLDPPTRGAIEVDGVELGRLAGDALCRFRNEKAGFVFQFHFLLSELSALENVLMPARKSGREREREPHARRLLARFGLGGKADRLPRQLSGGEQQRLAIARALVMQPKYLFADEPTGSLDSVNSDLVIALLRESNRTLGTTVVMVTHDPDYASQADRQIRLADGRLVAPGPGSS